MASHTPRSSSSSSSLPRSAIGGEDRKANARERQLIKLNEEIDSVAEEIKIKEAKLEDFQTKLLEEENGNKITTLKGFIDKLEQSITDLKSKERRKEEERRELTQALSDNTAGRRWIEPDDSNRSRRKRARLLSDEKVNRVKTAAVALLEEIEGLTITFDDLCDPRQLHILPFPSIVRALPIDRFRLDNNKYSFMGRKALHELKNEVKKSSGAPRINVYGTKGYGKSHILATYAMFMMQSADNHNPILYLANARDLAIQPEDYLRRSLVLAFARDEDAVNSVLTCIDLDALCAFATSRDYILIVDQLNSLEEESKVSSANKQLAQELIDTLESSASVFLRGFSANNQTAQMLTTQRSERDIMWLGGFDEDEYAAWLMHKEESGELPSITDDSLVEMIADMTGRVPLYLEGTTDAKVYGFVKAYTDAKEFKDDVNLRLAKAISLCGQNLSAVFSSDISQFAVDQDPTQYNTTADQVLRNDYVEFQQVLDHRYFFVRNRRGYAVSGIARNILVAYTRKQTGQSTFLQIEWIEACRSDPNPVTKGFKAEQIVISAIARNGLHLTDKLRTLPSETRKFTSAQEAAFTNDTKSCIQYVPAFYNYKHIDLLVRDLRSRKGRRKKPQAILIAFQPTMQSINAHDYSLDFFSSGDYKHWERGLDAFEIEWHFVWIVRKTEYQKRRRDFPVEYEDAPGFTEHCVSFEHVLSQLKIV